MATHAAIGTGGNANQFGAQTLDDGNDGKNFMRFARVRNGNDDVLAGHHAQIAMASFTWMHKKAGVPVEASVAAILLPIWPDLPMPVTTTRPVQFSISWHAWLKLSSSSGFKLINASISVCTTRCPEFMKVCWLIARVIVDKNELLIMANDVNCHQS